MLPHHNIQCYCAIKDKCGQTDEWSNGNGSLMRIIPLAFIKEISDKTIEDVSEITHAHNISKDICVKYIHIAKDLLDGMNLQDTIKKEVSNEFFDELLNVMQRISYQVVMLWTHSKFPYGVY